MWSPIRTVRLTYEHDNLDQQGSWLPPVHTLSNDNKPVGRNVKGKNNADYVIADVKAIRLGHVYVTEEAPWNQIENSIPLYFTTKGSRCEAMKGNKNQHIDFIRYFKINNKLCYQYLECKKSSGHMHEPPTMIKSSDLQLEALLHDTEDKRWKMMPSLYIIVSVDYCWKHKSWVNTFWALPVLRKEDFIVVATSKHRTFKPREIELDKHKLVK
jgi:hypothetical protein